MNHRETPNSWRIVAWVTSHDRHCVSNQLQTDCFVNCLFKPTVNKNIEALHGILWGVTTGGFPSQRASNAVEVSIRWLHHDPLHVPIVQLLGAVLFYGSDTARVCSAMHSALFIKVGHNRLVKSIACDGMGSVVDNVETLVVEMEKMCPLELDIKTAQNRERSVEIPLTHWGLVTPYGDIDLGQHWLR